VSTLDHGDIFDQANLQCTHSLHSLDSFSCVYSFYEALAVCQAMCKTQRFIPVFRGLGLCEGMVKGTRTMTPATPWLRLPLRAVSGFLGRVVFRKASQACVK
jgi:hypothetical protein